MGPLAAPFRVVISRSGAGHMTMRNCMGRWVGGTYGPRDTMGVAGGVQPSAVYKKYRQAPVWYYSIVDDTLWLIALSAPLVLLGLQAQSKDIDDIDRHDKEYNRWYVNCQVYS